jgi:hypothetical protein
MVFVAVFVPQALVAVSVKVMVPDSVAAAV